MGHHTGDMTQLPDPLHQRSINRGWGRRIFNCKAAQSGGIVRRAIRDVEREIGSETLIAAVRARGFHLIECGDQYLIICNSGGIRVLT